MRETIETETNQSDENSARVSIKHRWLLIGGGVLGVGLAIFLGLLFFVRGVSFVHYDEDKVPQFIQADFIELEKIYGISRFRSGGGHDYSRGSDETCRSMKHYFSPMSFEQQDMAILMQEPDATTATKVFSPVAGKITQISQENTPIGRQIHIQPTSHPEFTIRLFHVYPLTGIKTGLTVQAGQSIGLIHANQSTDISVEIQGFFTSQYFSYFSVMPDTIFANYQQRDIKDRTELIISRAERDANPLQCDGEQFVVKYDRDSQSSVYVYLSGYQPPSDQTFGAYGGEEPTASPSNQASQISPSPTTSSPSPSVTASSNQQSTPAPSVTATSTPASTSTYDEPPLLLKSIGLDLGTYDSNTNRAGDFLFTKTRLNFGRLWMDYAFTIPASQSAGGQDKRNPQPTFIVPLGTKVRSLVDGVVVQVDKIYSGDYTIMVGTGVSGSPWRYETEHVVNPLVVVGDRVTAGQIIAEAANFNNNAPEGYGIFEIGILKGGNPPSHICPFAYLDPSIKDNIFAKINQFYRDWENYVGDAILYDESTYPVPGCQILDSIAG